MLLSSATESGRRVLIWLTLEAGIAALVRYDETGCVRSNRRQKGSGMRAGLSRRSWVQGAEKRGRRHGLGGMKVGERWVKGGWLGSVYLNLVPDLQPGI